MRKAMVYFYLLTLMFAFGIPDAIAATCGMSVKVKNQSGKDVILKRVEVKRVGYNWHTTYTNTVNEKMDTSLWYASSANLSHGDCFKRHRYRVKFKCQNMGNDTTITSGDLRGDSANSLIAEVILKPSNC